MIPDNARQQLLTEVSALLRYQKELELDSVEVGDAFLEVSNLVSQASLDELSPQVLDVEPTETLSDAIAGDESCSVSLVAGRLSASMHSIGVCKRCDLHRRENNFVYGAGNPNAPLMLIGEGPGGHGEAELEPFEGNAGKLLDKMLAAMGFKRSDVYLVNIVAPIPSRHRASQPNEAEQCEPFLREHIKAVGPKVIVAMGRFTAQSLTGQKIPISRMRGQWKQYKGIDLMPTFHPDYLLRNAAGKRPVWTDLQAVMQRLGMRLPSR